MDFLATFLGADEIRADPGAMLPSGQQTQLYVLEPVKHEPKYVIDHGYVAASHHQMTVKEEPPGPAYGSNTPQPTATTAPAPITPEQLAMFRQQHLIYRASKERKQGQGAATPKRTSTVKVRIRRQKGSKAEKQLHEPVIQSPPISMEQLAMFRQQHLAYREEKQRKRKGN